MCGSSRRSVRLALLETTALPPRPIVNSALLGIACAVVILIAFDVFVLHMRATASATFDNNIRRTIHSLESPLLTRATAILTWIGSTVILPILAIASAALLRMRRLRHHAWFPVAAIVLAELVTESAKLIVKRPRPESWFSMPGDPWSFPSGHSLDSTACYFVCCAALLLLIESPLWRAALVLGCAALPIAIGLSRIYLGVHWPTDVLAGWLAGACLAGGLVRGLYRIRPC